MLNRIVRWFSLILVILATGAVAAAQAPPVPIQKFTIAGKAFGYSGGATSIIAADTAATVQFSPNWALRDDNVILSLPNAPAGSAPIGNFFLVGPQPSVPLGKLFKGTMLADPNLHFYGAAQLGVSRGPANQTMAESVLFGANYCPSGTVPACFNLGEVGWIHGSVQVGLNPNGTNRFANNGLRYSIGISF